MKLTPPHSVQELAQLLGASFEGAANHLVHGINEIHRVQAGDLTFVDVAKYYKKALSSAADTILIDKVVEVPAGKALIISADPFRDFNRLTEHFQPRRSLSEFDANPAGVHPSVKMGQHVVIGENVQIGPNVEIGHNVVIAGNVIIGEGSQIFSNVTIYENSILGKHVVIQAGSRIGGEAFYYKKRPHGRDKMLSKGYTILEDYVEVGANTTIDRGVTAETRIGAHTKIDNLVQIGHDTVVGQRCIIAALAGIAGVSTLEDDVIVWGQVGIPSDVTIGKGAVLMAKAGVISDLPGGKTYMGMPAAESIAKLRQYASLEQLPRYIHKLEQLED